MTCCDEMTGPVTLGVNGRINLSLLWPRIKFLNTNGRESKQEDTRQHLQCQSKSDYVLFFLH